MDLSIIIVSWNVKEKLRDNLQALFSLTLDFNFEIFVVDNNSSDGSVEMIKSEFNQVKLIINTENLGFAKANNQAIKESKGNFILLLNPDMKVYPDTLSKMLIFAQNNPQATISGCKLVSEKGAIIKQVRRFPQLFDQLMITLKIPHLFPFVLINYVQINFDYTKSSKVDSIRGAFFLINRVNYYRLSNNSLPLLDERYFIWFEEVDFCRQVYKLGGEVWYNSEATCLDYVGASFSQLKVGASFSQLKIKQTQKYFRDSMLKYFAKWEKPYKYIILKSAWNFVDFILDKR